MTRKKGFTLIELLVVIAVIAVLLAILIPTLKRAKEAGMRVLCLNNVRSLTAGLLVYVNDYENRLPYAGTNANGWIDGIPGYGTNPWAAPVEDQHDALRRGLIYPYLNNIDVYRCPMAKKNERRTFSMVHALNGNPGTANYGGEIVYKITEIRNTSGRIAFLGDYITDYDAAWMIYDDRAKWWNTTPIRHGAGGNVFSYLDGHSEFHKWKDKRTIDLTIKCNELNTPEARNYHSAQPDNEDIIWAQRAAWGELGYTPTP